MLPLRYWPFVGVVVIALAALAAMALSPTLAWGWLTVFAIAGGLSVVGIIDLSQQGRSLRRNYPLLAHLRFMLDSIGPEIRQYFIEADTDERPFSRLQRNIVYQRSKNALDKRPFGTQLDVYAPRFEWMTHSLAPTHPADHDFRIVVGPDRPQPYSASVLNISAMSFGSLSANAIRALNGGAKRGNFYQDTGEGSISQYHREAGGDLVWQVASGYFGCRAPDGGFSEAAFAANAASPQVRMIEVKLSQGAKPGHGGVLPAAKVSPEIAAARGVPVGVDCVSPAAHSEFSTPIGLLQFVERLRNLSGGKPTGFKLAIGHPWEWFGIAKAMLETGILPDFIVVDGGEGGTGAAPLEFTDHVGTPLHEALLLVHNTLVGTNLRSRIRIGAAGKVITAFDIARTMALGADWCNAARGFMFSLGCVQSLSCHTDHCPTGIATQDPTRQRSLVPGDKATRVFQFHENTLEALRELIGAAGLLHPSELGPEHIIRRISTSESRPLSRLLPFLKPGELLEGECALPVFQAFWDDARADSFAPPARVLAMRSTKIG